MATTVSTVLIAAPPAFLAGWVLSKAMLARFITMQAAHGNVAAPAADTGHPQAAAALDAAESAPSATPEVSGQQDGQDDVSSSADTRRFEAEIRLLREAVAERDQQLGELKQKLQIQVTLPEDTPATARGKTRKVMERMQASLTTYEREVGELKQKLETTERKSRRTAERFSNWRKTTKPLARQFRQQRVILNELRDELRQRDQQQREHEDALEREREKAHARKQASGDVPATTPAAELPESAATSKLSKPTTAAELPGSAAEAEQPEPTAAAEQPEPAATSKLPEPTDRITAGLDAEADYGDEEREDLQALRGIGPALHKKLNEKGVYRIKQLAVMDAEDLRLLCKSVGVSQKQIEKTDWTGQARRLLNMPVVSAVETVGG